MKRYDNLWSQVCSLDNLIKAFYQARKAKRGRKIVAGFEYNLESQLLEIQAELLAGHYQPSCYDYFKHFEPKERDILAPHWRDRLIQHAIYRVIASLFDETFIYDSYACRRDKGLHFAMNRVKKFIASACAHQSPAKVYYLKLDIKKYFSSISWDVLLYLLSLKIKDKQLLVVLGRIITHHDYLDRATISRTIINPKERKGIPIGNLTSQLFANIYLNHLDQYLKRSLKVRYYGRYMDDFFIIHPSRSYLLDLKDKIAYFLEKQLSLELHKYKVTLDSLDHGINFVGYKIFKDHVVVRGSTLKKIKGKLKRSKWLMARHELTPDQFSHILNSVEGFLSQANTYNLRQSLKDYFGYEY